jgi:hypothetical protein
MRDFVLRYRHETDDNHLNTAALVRSIGGVDNRTGQGSHVFGYGVMGSGLCRLQDKDNFLFQAVYGQGVTRYFNDTGGLHLDAGFTSIGTIKAQPAYEGHASIQHWWNDKWRSNFTEEPRRQIHGGRRNRVGITRRQERCIRRRLRINVVLQYDLVSLQEDLKKLTRF